MKKDYNKDYKHIVIKNDEEYKKFEMLCEKLNLKKASVVKALIKKFNENPAEFLLERIK